MSVFLLDALREKSLLDAIETQFKPEIPGLKRIRIDDLAVQARKGEGRTLVLVALPESSAGYFARIIELVGRFRAETFFILIGGELTAAQYKQLIQYGNADWVGDYSQPGEILEIISTQQAKKATAPSTGRQRPFAISFAPSAGGVGNSTLAVETAIQLCKRGNGADGTICLFDLDFQNSHVCDYLDIEPRLNLDEIIGAPERLDAELVGAFASKHPSGLRVFAARREVLRSRDLSVEELSTLLDLIAQRYSDIVMDLPVAHHAWSHPVLAASQGVVVTGRNTIPGLRQLAETLAAVREQAPNKVAVRPAVNGCEFGLLGGLVRADHVARILVDEKPFFIRHSPLTLESVNAGTPMSQSEPSAKIVKDIGAITEFCLELKAARPDESK